MESAGMKASFVRPEAIAAMGELGIDISAQRSKNFKGSTSITSSPFVTTPRKPARCFPALRKKRRHNFEDPPALHVGTDDELYGNLPARFGICAASANALRKGSSSLGFAW